MCNAYILFYNENKSATVAYLLLAEILSPISLLFIFNIEKRQQNRVRERAEERQMRERANSGEKKMMQINKS